MAYLTAEPASIFYIATGIAGLIFARFRTSAQHKESSVAMLFCRTASREKLRQIRLVN